MRRRNVPDMGSVPVSPAADGPAGCAEERQDGARDDQDDPDRPEDADVREEADDQQHDARG